MDNFPSVKAVVAKVRELAFVYPGQVYELPEGAARCQYMHADGPGCIFGHALFELGVSAEQLREIDARGGSANIRTILAEAYEGDGCDVEASRWCGSVQVSQDFGHPWGEAVSRADLAYPLASF